MLLYWTGSFQFTTVLVFHPALDFIYRLILHTCLPVRYLNSVYLQSRLRRKHYVTWVQGLPSTGEVRGNFLRVQQKNKCTLNSAVTFLPPRGTKALKGNHFNLEK